MGGNRQPSRIRRRSFNCKMICLRASMIKTEIETHSLAVKRATSDPVLTVVKLVIVEEDRRRSIMVLGLKEKGD